MIAPIEPEPPRFALIDGNTFYVSCERVFDPSLRGKPTGIVAVGASPHHFLGVESHLRDVLAWFGALVAPTSVYLTGSDFEDGRLREEPARALDALLGTLVLLGTAADEAALGPPPLAARFSRG